MTRRELVVTLNENGNVEYLFNRDRPLSRYVIEFPANRILLPDQDTAEAGTFRIEVTPTGNTLLVWKGTEDGTGPGAPAGPLSLRYIKMGLLSVVQDLPLLLNYKERIHVKGQPSSPFRLLLHGRGRRVSAVKAVSRASFLATSFGLIHSHHCYLRSGRYDCFESQVTPGMKVKMQPTELADAFFHCSGFLYVNWILEIDSSMPLI